VNWDKIIHNGANLLAVVLLVLLNAFFVAAELALVRIRDTQLAALAAKGNRRAKMARHILSRIDTYISTTQFGITLASMALGVVIDHFPGRPARHRHRRGFLRELLSANCGR